MAYQDILFYLDSSRHCPKRLKLASFLAHRFEARLEGFYVMPDIDISPFTADNFAPESLMQIQTAAALARDQARELFEGVLLSEQLRGGWAEGRGAPTELVVGRAKVNDLAIIGQTDPDEIEVATPSSLPEEVALTSGRPIVVVPYAGEFGSIGDRVLLAWNASAQAARAVGDAMPILAGAKHVTVITIGGENEEWSHGEVSDADLMEYLERHGVRAELRRTIAADAKVGDLILSQAADHGADMIVMGVYGHARLRELVLGGVSRQIFTQMTVPVFMAH